MIPTHALTVKQPWAEAILRGKKWYEFRTWTPPEGTAWIALHAGKEIDKRAFGEQRFVAPLPEDCRGWTIYNDWRGAVVGLVRIKNVRPVNMDPDFWCDHPGCPKPPGGYAWTLCGATILPKPIPCRGQQRLWRLPNDVRAQIAEQLEATE